MIKKLVKNKNHLIFLLSSFIAGFATMTVELTASRLVSPYIGSSIYTWTSIIGVILAGLSFGYLAGGKIADKYPIPPIIALVYIAAGVATGIAPHLLFLASIFVLSSLPFQIITIGVAMALFFIPSFFLGMISPILLRYYADSISTIGFKAGALSAFWSLGSIIGTFLTGFFFISFLGSTLTFTIISATLLLNGIIFSNKKYYFLLIILAILTIIILNRLKILTTHSSSLLFDKESNYYAIKVVEKDFFSKGKVRILFLDSNPNGIESLNNQKLNTYPEIYPIFGVLNPNLRDILVIGGGAYSMPKFVHSYYENSRVIVIEIDPKVAEVAHRFFNLDNSKIPTIFEDGRVALQKRTNKYDLIFEDAFNSFISLPWHLSTKEFMKLAKSRLNPNGIYAVNFITRSSDKDKFFNSMVKTFISVFPNAYIILLRNLFSPVQNVVLIGINSSEHYSIEELQKKIEKIDNGGHQWLINRIFEINNHSLQKGIILTDDYAPLEWLMTDAIKNYFELHSHSYYSFLN